VGVLSEENGREWKQQETMFETCGIREHNAEGTKVRDKNTK
jgi:hypothetical protein